MAGRDDGSSEYDPTEFARGGVKKFSSDAEDDSDTGIGMRPEKNPTATLRLITSNMGSQWLMYGSIGGGRQDFQPPRSKEDKAGCDWFEFYYRGIIHWKRQETFGYWKIMVKGKGLEPVCHWVGKHILTTLRPGTTEHSLQKITLSSIIIEECKLVPQNGSSLDDADE